FAKFKMTLDYQAKKMTLIPNGFDPPDLLQKMMAWMMSREKKAERRILAPEAQWGFTVSKDAKDEEPGVTVKEVYKGSAAADAGLQAGDRLLVMDHRWTDSVSDCYTAATHVPAGSTAKVVIKRKGMDMEIAIKPRPGL